MITSVHRGPTQDPSIRVCTTAPAAEGAEQPHDSRYMQTAYIYVGIVKVLLSLLIVLYNSRIGEKLSKLLHI